MDINFIKEQFTKDLHHITLSNPRKKQEVIKKITITPFIKDNRLMFQFESFTSTQAFHENLDITGAIEHFYNYLSVNDYKQIDGFTLHGEWHALLSKKGHITLKTSLITSSKIVDLDHNRQKQYLLQEGKPVAFLVALGVMTPEGKVVKKRYDKFKQINRFIEMVDDVMKELPRDKTLRIIDFGCGRSYLTFALYHYITQIKNQKVTILGLDLKVKVIEDCNELATSCGYEDLTFKQGDIIDYESVEDIDMVVTLHACNTATDIALKKAVTWNAKVILSVPCCQHELNQQIHSDPLQDLFQYGIIKERTAALFTDAMRANWLKLHGYDVQILEFIDVAHTPKNLLLRGVKVQDVQEETINYEAYDAMEHYLNSNLTLRKL